MLITTSIIEVGAGLGLVIWPSTLAEILVGQVLEMPTGLTVGRIAGIALCALGVACWLARNDAQGRAGAGLVTGMLVYNLGVATILALVALGQRKIGVGLWPTVVLHTGMSVWCIRDLRYKGRAK